MGNQGVLQSPGSGVAVYIGLDQSTEQVGNTAATLTTLHTYTLPANSLEADGDSIEFEIYGTFSAVTVPTVAVRLIAPDLTDQVVFTQADVAPASPSGFVLRGRIVRSGASVQKSMASLVADGVSYGSVETLTMDTTLPIVFVFEADGTLANDVRHEGSYIRFFGIRP